jgi:hypothetical protein
VDAGIESQQSFLKGCFRMPGKMAIRPREALTGNSFFSSTVAPVSVVFTFEDRQKLSSTRPNENHGYKTFIIQH